MPLPTSVKIGPYTYVIVEDKAFTDSHNAWAYMRHGAQRIDVDPSTMPDRMRVAIWHEIKHACYELTGCGDSDTEERTITATAPMEIQVLRDNPELVAYLMEP